LKILERYQKNKKIEEYKALNGGRPPPEDALTALGKSLLPCFFRDDVYIKVGADMVNQQRR
jgi:hypothetical protein